MNKIFLRFVTFLNPLLKNTGVDTEQLYQILKVKLLMDERRPNTAFAARRNAKNNKPRNPVVVALFSVLMGCFIGMVLFIDAGPLIAQTLYFTIYMAFIGMTLISDFTNVLIDSKDQFILLPRPVNDRTIAMSRIFHISIYLLRLTLPLALPGIVMIGFIDGILAVPLFIGQLLLITFLAVFSVNMVYLLLMRAVSPQKFKDIISYFQIGFSILIFGTYYLVPRLINVKALAHNDILSHVWAYFLPPVWVAALNDLFFHAGRLSAITWLFGILGITIPIVGLWFVAKVLAPGFNKRLAVISTSDVSSKPVTNSKSTSKFNLIDAIGRIVSPEPIENAGFKITAKLTARTREFKMKVYPSFAYIPIYFIYFAMNTKGDDLSSKFEDLQNSHSYIFLIYMCSLILTTVASNITMSSKYKSAWVYYALPIDEPGKILLGMFKAMLVFYYLPYCFVIGLLIISIWGYHAINDMILAILVSTIYGMLSALFIIKGLPFSRPVSEKQGGGRVIISFLVLFFIGGIGYLHYLIMKWETAIWVAIIPFFIINWVMFHYYKKQTWENIELIEE